VIAAREVVTDSLPVGMYPLSFVDLNGQCRELAVREVGWDSNGGTVTLELPVHL
jgi:hypothetical protein